jgi:hypothetical protein
MAVLICAGAMILMKMSNPWSDMTQETALRFELMATELGNNHFQVETKLRDLMRKR